MSQANGGESAETITELTPFEVSADEDKNYHVKYSLGATGLSVPLENVPTSMTVFNETYIEDVGANGLQDILDYDPTTRPTNASREIDWYTARGFSGQDAEVVVTLVDGIPQPTFTGTTAPFTGMERVEVMRGPESILHGTGAVGLVVNRVSKKPMFSPLTNLRFVTGFHEHNTDSPIYEFYADVNRPMDVFGENKVSFRINFSHIDSGLELNPSKIRETVAIPRLLWRVSPKTTLEFGYEHIDTVRNPGRGLPWAEDPETGEQGVFGFTTEGERIEVPLWTNLGSVNDQYTNKTNSWIVELKHEFGEDWNFRSFFKDQRYFFERDELVPFSTLVVSGPDNAFVAKARRVIQNRSDDFFTRQELAYTGEFVGSKQNLIAGVEYQKSEGNAQQWRKNFWPGNCFSCTREELEEQWNPWELVPLRPDPVFSRDARPSSLDVADVPHITNFASENDRTSFYISDLASLANDRLFLMAGFRYTEWDESDSNFLNGSTSSQSTSADIWSFGTVYHLVRDRTISLYLNHNQSFEPVFTTSDDGFNLPPITGEQLEGGVRLSLFNHNVSVELAAYDITRKGIPVEITSDEDPQDNFRPSEGRQSEGFEIHVAGQITENWRMFGGFAYTDAEEPFGSGPFSRPDGRVFGVPETNLTFFTRYDIDEGVMEGWHFTLGLVDVGEFWNGERGSANRYVNGNFAPNAAIPDFKYDPPARLDFGFGKSFQWNDVDWTFKGIVRNLADETILQNFHRRTNTASAAPFREWRFSLGMEF